MDDDINRIRLVHDGHLIRQLDYINILCVISLNYFNIICSLVCPFSMADWFLESRC